jgi:flagellar motor switch protein FliG
MLQGYDRAAAVLSLLGDELSQRILSYIPEDMAVSIMAASERLKTPSKEDRKSVV